MLLCWVGSAMAPADVFPWIWLRAKEVWIHGWDFQDCIPENWQPKLLLICISQFSSKGYKGENWIHGLWAAWPQNSLILAQRWDFHLDSLRKPLHSWGLAHLQCLLWVLKPQWEEEGGGRVSPGWISRPHFGTWRGGTGPCWNPSPLLFLLENPEPASLTVSFPPWHGPSLVSCH